MTIHAQTDSTTKSTQSSSLDGAYIIVIVGSGLLFIFSVTVVIRLRIAIQRRNRRLERRRRREERLKEKLLHKEDLEKFPKGIYSDAGVNGDFAIKPPPPIVKKPTTEKAPEEIIEATAEIQATSPKEMLGDTPIIVPLQRRNSIPLNRMETIHKTRIVGDSTCSICLEEFQEKMELVVLDHCGHYFHTECISEWLTKKSPKCPLCRVDYRRPKPAS